MGQVVVTVNGRQFPINCDDGQEPRVRRLAQYVDTKIGEFARTLGQIDEAKMILLAALVIADELSDSNEALLRERGRARDAAASSAAGAANGIRGIAQRIETIAARLDTP